MPQPSLNIEIKEFKHNFKISVYESLNIINVRTFKDIIFNDSFKKKNIILDLKELEYIDSSGIGLLFALIKLQREYGMDIKLDNISVGVKDILVASGLYGFYEGEDDGTA
jgi:anti-sigma B factor antagonist